MADEEKAADGLEQIEELCAMAISAGQWNYSPYLRGYANALLLAVSILRETKWQPMPPPPVYLQDMDRLSNIDVSEGKPCRFDVSKLCLPACGRRIGICARRSL